MEAEEDNERVRIPLGSGTYATKVKGKLVMVRDKKPETAFEIGMDLLGEAFRGPLRSPKSKKGSPNLEDFQTAQFQQHPGNMFPFNQHTTYHSEQPTMTEPNQPESQPHSFGPGPEVTMGPHGYGPHPRGGYGAGNRQLALIPLGGHQCMGSNQNPYSQSWIHSPGQMNGNLSHGSAGNIDPWQPFMTRFPNNAPQAHNYTSTQHICANCKKLRSRKYQAENPIIAGEMPVLSFCRKCQKDTSSTEDTSDGSEYYNRTARKSKKSVNKKIKEEKKISKHQKKYKGDGDAGSSEEFLDSEEQPASSLKGEKDRLQDDYVVVRDSEDNGPGRRRSSLRIDINDKPRITRHQEPPSPLVQQSFEARSSTSGSLSGPRYFHSERSPSPGRSFIAEHNGSRHRSFIESSYRRPLSTGFTRQTATEKQFEDLYLSNRRNPRTEYDGFEREGRERSPNTVDRDHDPLQSPPRRDYIVEERDADASSMKSDSRRYEQDLDTQPQNVPSRLPHNIGPLKEGEIVVVTERYVYRPKRLKSVQGRGGSKFRGQKESPDSSQQSQNYSDRTKPDADRQYLNSTTEFDASENYPNDWNHAKYSQVRKVMGRRRVRPRDLDENYAPYSQELEDVSDIPRHVSTNELYLSRAPTPPALIRRTAEKNVNRRTESDASTVPYPLDDEEAFRNTRSTERRRTRKTSYRPPYVREGTEGGTEQALIPSPGHSRERRITPEHMSDSLEENKWTEERRVQFQEPEIQDAWSAATAPSADDTNENDWAPTGGHDRW